MARILAAVYGGWSARLALAVVVGIGTMLALGVDSPLAGSTGCVAYTPGSSPGFSMGDSTSILGKAGLVSVPALRARTG
jgi:hypothetical protein